MHCMMAETQYLRSDDPDGYFAEGMTVGRSVVIYVQDLPFEKWQIEAVRADEKRVFESAVVTMRTWTESSSTLEMIRRYKCPVINWAEVDWL